MMKANTKKILSMLLCLTMVIGLLPMTALADDGDTAQTGASTQTQGFLLDGKYTTYNSVPLISTLSYTVYVCRSAEADQTICFHNIIFFLPEHWDTPAEDDNFAFAFGGESILPGLNTFKSCTVTIKKNAAGGSAATLSCYELSVQNSIGSYIGSYINLKSRVTITVLNTADFATLKSGGALVTFQSGTGYSLTARDGETQGTDGSVTAAVPAGTADLTAYYPAVTVTDTTKHQDATTPWVAGSGSNTYVPNLVSCNDGITPVDSDKDGKADKYILPGSNGRYENGGGDDVTVVPKKNADGTLSYAVATDGHVLLPLGGSVTPNGGTAVTYSTAAVLDSKTGEKIADVMLVKECEYGSDNATVIAAAYDDIHVTDGEGFTATPGDAGNLPKFTGLVSTAADPASVGAEGVKAGGAIISVNYYPDVKGALDTAGNAIGNGVADKDESVITFDLGDGTFHNLHKFVTAVKKACADDKQTKADFVTLAATLASGIKNDGYTFSHWSTEPKDADLSTELKILANYTKNGGGGSTGGGSTGGGSTGGGSTGGGPGSGGTTVDDGKTPTGSTPTLNKGDHFAYLNGYSDGTVHPNANITRAEAAEIFYRLLSDSTRKEYFKQKNNFSDVDPDAWYNSAVSTLSNAGIITGYIGGTFEPNGLVTRQELAAIVTRFCDASTKTYDVDPYTDVSTSWARQYIDRAAELGVIHGYADGTFRPDNNVTRAETVTVVNNVLGRSPEKNHLLTSMKTWTDNADPSAWYYAAIQEATNSHDFTKGATDTFETWTAIKASPDWAALEAEWAKN